MKQNQNAQMITFQVDGKEITTDREHFFELLGISLEEASQKMGRVTVTSKPKAIRPEPVKYNPLRPYRKGMEPTVPKAKRAEPFRTVEDYQGVVNSIREHHYPGETSDNPISWMKLRDTLLVTMGCTVALRISDLLRLTVYQVLDERGFIRDFITPVREQKTSKTNSDIPLTEAVKVVLYDYLRSLPEVRMDDYLFRSRKKNRNGDYVITQQQAYRILRRAAEDTGLDYHVSTHTLRKTCGTFAYEMHPEDISVIQNMYNHDSQQDTFRYIGTMQKRRKVMVDAVSAALNEGMYADYATIEMSVDFRKK